MVHHCATEHAAEADKMGKVCQPENLNKDTVEKILQEPMLYNFLDNSEIFGLG